MRAILDIAVNDLRILFKDPGLWIYLVVMPLILAYVAAIGLAFWTAWRVAIDRRFKTIGLWAALNRHLLYAIESLPQDKSQNLCGQGGDEPWTLAYRIPDYLHHMRHHLEQIRRFA